MSETIEDMEWDEAMARDLPLPDEDIDDPPVLAYPSTPTLDRMLEVKDESRAIGEFLEWLMSMRSLAICDADEFGRFYPVHLGIEALLAEYYKIDLNEAERERSAILEHIRRLQDEN